MAGVVAKVGSTLGSKLGSRLASPFKNAASKLTSGKELLGKVATGLKNEGNISKLVDASTMAASLIPGSSGSQTATPQPDTPQTNVEPTQEDPAQNDVLESIMNRFKREQFPDQTKELSESINDTLKNLDGVLFGDIIKSRRSLVGGFSELIQETIPTFIPYMNEALIETAINDQEIRLKIRSFIQDMIADIIKSLTENERNVIVKNLNRECRVAFQTM